MTRLQLIVLVLLLPLLLMLLSNTQLMWLQLLGRQPTICCGGVGGHSLHYDFSSWYIHIQVVITRQRQYANESYKVFIFSSFFASNNSKFTTLLLLPHFFSVWFGVSLYFGCMQSDSQQKLNINKLGKTFNSLHKYVLPTLKKQQPTTWKSECQRSKLSVGLAVFLWNSGFSFFSSLKM